MWHKLNKQFKDRERSFKVSRSRLLSKEVDPNAHVCCKLVLLYVDALEYQGTESIIRAAYRAAHAADFDATMTKVVFQTMLKVQRRSNIRVSSPKVVLKIYMCNKIKTSSRVKGRERLAQEVRPLLALIEFVVRKRSP